MTSPAGLQPERTALAWQRTAITATVVMVPLIVVNGRLGLWPMSILSAVATTAAGVLVVGVHRRFSQLRAQERPSPYLPMAGVAVVSALAAVVAVLNALVLALR
jgi:uncharacterized membrane protein YidH (DUF202 family)